MDFSIWFTVFEILSELCMYINKNNLLELQRQKQIMGKFWCQKKQRPWQRFRKMFKKFLFKILLPRANIVIENLRMMPRKVFYFLLYIMHSMEINHLMPRFNVRMYLCLIIFFSWFEGKWRISYRIVWNCQQLQFAKKACCHCCCSHFTSTSCIGRKRWRERWNRWRRIFQETEFGKYYYSSFNAKKIFGHAFISNRWWKSWTDSKNLMLIYVYSWVLWNLILTGGRDHH